MFNLSLFRLLSRTNFIHRAHHVAAARRTIARLSRNHNTLNTNHNRNRIAITCRQVTSAAVRKSENYDIGSDLPHDSHPVERHHHDSTSPLAEEYRIAIETLAVEGDLAGCVAALAQMQASEIPCTREIYKSFLQAIVNYPDTSPQSPMNVAALLVEQAGVEGREAQRRDIPKHLVMENRNGLDAETAWRRYDAYLTLDELRQLLFDIAIPAEHSTADLVLRIMEDIAEAIPVCERKRKEPTLLFSNHERLQQLYAHGVLGNREELESALMKLWDEAPGLETELPFHLLANFGNETNPLQAASTAFLVFGEMEARESRWSAEAFISLISSLLEARNCVRPEKVLSHLFPMVHDVVRRRNRSLVMRRIYGWGLGHENEGDGITAEGEGTENSYTSLSDRPPPIDNRLAARIYAAIDTSYVDTGVLNTAQLSRILSALDISHAKRTNQDADATARLILNIALKLTSSGRPLTQEEKARRMSAWAHFGQWGKILNRAPRAMHKMPPDHMEYRPILTLYLTALCRTGKFDKAFAVLSKLDRQRKMDIEILDVMLDILAGTDMDGLPHLLKVYFELIPKSGMERTQNTYANAISAFCQRGCPWIAEKIFEDMLNANVPPHRGIFLSLARGYVATDKPTTGSLMLKRMDEYGIQRELQDYVVYFRQLVKTTANLLFRKNANALECKLSHSKALTKMQTVLVVYQEMMEEGPMPDSYCTEKAFAACFTLRNTQCVEDIFKFSQSNNISLSPNAYHWLINWNVQINNRQGIENLLTMAERKKVSLKTKTHSLVIKLYCREDTDDVITYYRKFRNQKKLKPDHIMVAQLFGILRSRGAWDLVEDLLQELREMRYTVPPRVLTQGATSIYQRGGDIKNSIAYINAMRSIGAQMEIQTYEFLMWRLTDHACRYFPKKDNKEHIPRITPIKIEPEEAADVMRSLFAHMRNANLNPTPFVYRLMILSLSAVRDWTGAVEIVKMARKMRVELDSKTEEIVPALLDHQKACDQASTSKMWWKIDQDLANNWHSVDFREEAVESELNSHESAAAERDGDKEDDWSSWAEEDRKEANGSSDWQVHL